MPEGTINKQVTAAFAKKLWNGVVEGYGKDIVSIDYDSPDYKMLTALQNNVWSFAGAKNYHQLRELGNALIGADGKLISFSKFKELALAINNKYTVSHLKTEYNLAVAGGQMAGKWEQIKEQQDIFPYLKFDAVLDKQTTDLCRDLDGTTLPIDHPFWKRYYPPNHFNCRSTVRQVTGGPVTPDSRIPAVDIPPMFQTNLGEAGLIFPKTHPYFIDLPKEVLSFGDANFSLVEFRKGKGKVYESGLTENPYKKLDVRHQIDVQIKREAADAIADYFNTEVFTLPEFATTRDWRYPYFYKNLPIPNKMPDLLFDGYYWEVESYEKAFKASKIIDMLRSGARQSDRIVIKLKHSVNIANVISRAQGSLQSSTKLTGIKQVLLLDKYNNLHVVK